MPKQKLLVLTTTFPRWENDTARLFIYELCLELRDKNFDISVLAPHHWQAKLQEYMEGLKIYRFPYFYPRRYQRLCYEAGIMPNMRKSILARLQSPLLILCETYHALRLCKKKKIDIIHSHWIIPSGFAGAICKKLLGTKHLLTLHTDTFVLKSIPFNREITKFIARNSDQITVVGSHIKKELLAQIPSNLKYEIEKKISVAPMGTYTDMFRGKPDIAKLKAHYKLQGKAVLLFMGRLVEKKGVSYLIKAMPEIVSKNKDVTLIICGDGPLQSNLEHLVEELMLQDYVRFTGYVIGDKKLDYLALSDILLVPSIVAESGDTEGLPIVIQEGLASGVPIIASNAGGIREIVKNGRNGFLVGQKNCTEIAAKVLELISNQKIRVQFSLNAIETSKQFDWAIIGRKYCKILKELSNKK